ncbi:MAG: gliding motility-associated protein GldE [Cytophagales bacterium]
MDSSNPDSFQFSTVFLQTALVGGIPTYAVLFFALVFLLTLSAFVSGAEVAFFSIDYQQRIELKTSNNPKERKIAEILEKPQKLLATILILNNLFNITFVTISTYLTWLIFGTKDLKSVVILVITILVTFAIVFFGEIIPKIYATRKNLELAGFAVYPLDFFVKLLSPISFLLLSLGKFSERLLGKEEYSLSVDDLNDAIDLNYEKEVTEEHKEILKGVVNFGSISAKQVMKSRIDIAAAEHDWDFHHLMEFINQMGYSRIPVFKETIDQIVGVLYVKDLLNHLNEPENFKWQSFLREVYFVPENKKIDVLLKEFQKRRVHMAIVVDEYGGTSGLVTMEDIIEEVVGEINDEYDEVEKTIELIDTNEYLIDTKISINDFLKNVDLPFDTFDDFREDSETIAGLLLNINKNMPSIGDKISCKGISFEILSLEKKRIGKAKVLISSAE